MSSLFLGKKALRSQYYEATEAQVNATTGQADAFLLCVLPQQSRIVLFDNGLNTPIKVWLAHPEADSQADPTTRLGWIEIPSQKPINFDISGTVGLSLDAHTKIYISKVGSNSTNGEKVRLVTWG